MTVIGLGKRPGSTKVAGDGGGFYLTGKSALVNSNNGYAGSRRLCYQFRVSWPHGSTTIYIYYSRDIPIEEYNSPHCIVFRVSSRTSMIHLHEPNRRFSRLSVDHTETRDET